MNSQFCPHCNSAAEWIEGWVPERFGWLSINELGWIDGVPESSFWQGKSYEDGNRKTIRGKRCKSCGYLVLLAVATKEASNQANTDVPPTTKDAL